MKTRLLTCLSILIFTPTLHAKNVVVERKPVPVSVTVANQYWVETISICNNGTNPIPLADIEFNFNYAVKMPENIWGQPWSGWRVASQQDGKVVLLGGSQWTLMPDPTCKNPLTIQFNAAPETPAPTGPFVFKAAVESDTPPPPPPPPVDNTASNGSWVYDAVYNDAGKRTGNTPGLFAENINRYNASASVGHKLTHLFTYGGDMEMFCQGSGGSSSSTPCDEKTMQVFYNPQSTAAYYNAAKNSGNAVKMYPIVDGVVGGEYLKTFNSLTQAQAQIYADKVAKLYCADNLVEGVQFDLEPFDINQPGQARFFSQIAKNFAGQHNGPGQPDPFNCVNASHPKGRTFSVFTYSGRVNSTLAAIFNQYGNGIVIDSLYDLGSNAGGVANSLAAYTTYVNGEVTNMMNRARTNNVKYQFGIPAAASVHEFETVDGRNSGVTQLDYVKAAINAINIKGAKTDTLYRGTNLWGWNQRMFWSGKEFTPSIPNTVVLNYLGTRL